MGRFFVVVVVVVVVVVEEGGFVVVVVVVELGGWGVAAGVESAEIASPRFGITGLKLAIEEDSLEIESTSLASEEKYSLLLLLCWCWR